MNELHVIVKKENKNTITKVENSTDVWDSLAWDISDESANRLLGGKFYIHETQSGKPYFGGSIISWRYYEQDGVVIHSRKVIRFIFDANCKNVPSSRKGWSQEKKLVWVKGE